MATAKMYDKKGNTVLSARGAGVLLMVRHVARQGEGHGSITKAYAEYAASQSYPVTYNRYYRLVTAFLPCFLRGDFSPFNLLNDSTISYLDALSFANEVNDMVSKANRMGYTLQRNRGRLPRKHLAVA